MIRMRQQNRVGDEQMKRFIEGEDRKRVPRANPRAVVKLEAECQALFSKLASLQKKIREKLSLHADGKHLKGNELVGWLGEIYGKIFLNGKLVDDREEHDFVSKDGLRVSVKTRKGLNSGWKQTSAIPKIKGKDCPTHLLFVHLTDDYSIDRMWLLKWRLLVKEGRFKKHIVRGSQRSFKFSIDEEKDKAHVVYVNDRKKSRSTQSSGAARRSSVR